MLDLEGGEGDHVGGRVLEHHGYLREARPELLDHAPELRGDLVRRGLREDRAHHGGDQRLGALRHAVSRLRFKWVRQRLPLLAGQQRVDRVREAAVVVGDDQLHAGEASFHETLEEDPPGSLILSRPGVEPYDLAVAFTVHGRGTTQAHLTMRPPSRTRTASASSHR